MNGFGYRLPGPASLILIKAMNPISFHNLERAEISSSCAEASISTEIELKLVVGAGDLPKVKRVLVDMAARRSPVDFALVSTYYDTSDFALNRAGFTLRVRTQEGRHLQTLKAKCLGRSPLARDEWEDTITSTAPDPTAPETRKRMPKTVDPKDLRPQFTTTVQRTTIELEPHRATRIEAAIDIGSIHSAHGRGIVPIQEVELELKSGSPAALYDLALLLLKHAPFRIETRSKAERGYSLIRAGSEVESIAHAIPVALNADMSVDAALQTIGHHCLAHLLHNQQMALAGEAEAIHQMRVAMRRLRSALSALKPMLSAEQHRWSSNKLRLIADTLAAARNWDMVLTGLVPPVLDALPLRHDLKSLANAADLARRTAHRSMHEAICSERYTAAVLGVSRWFETHAWRGHSASDETVQFSSPIGDIAPNLLDRRRRQVRRLSKNFAALTPADRHQLRIALKKLRYTVELFATLFDKKDVLAYVRHLEPLQDTLGLANDLRVAHDLFAELHGKDSHQNDAVSRAGGLVLGWYERDLASREPALHKYVGRMRRAKPYWR